MDLSLAGRRALVCGASQGIGRAAAVALASLGARLTLVARDAVALRAVRDELPAVSAGAHGVLPLDFDDIAAVRREIAALIGREGAHEIVVNNSGGPAPGPIATAEPEEFLRAISRHVVANQIVAQATVPGMKAAGYGRIISVISTSVYEPIANLGVSNTTRAAVAAWAKTLSKELGAFGITVNNVLPGYTDTERLASLIEARARREKTSVEAVAASMRAQIPSGRFAAPHEIGEVIAFLASPAASYVNGVSLPVDAGRLASI